LNYSAYEYKTVFIQIDGDALKVIGQIEHSTAATRTVQVGDLAVCFNTSGFQIVSLDAPSIALTSMEFPVDQG